MKKKVTKMSMDISDEQLFFREYYRKQLFDIIKQYKKQNPPDKPQANNLPDGQIMIYLNILLKLKKLEDVI